jgi:hypothetical protein
MWCIKVISLTLRPSTLRYILLGPLAKRCTAPKPNFLISNKKWILQNFGKFGDEYLAQLVVSALEVDELL